MKVGVDRQELWTGTRPTPHSHIPEGVDGWAAQTTLRTKFMNIMELEKRLKDLFSVEFTGIPKTHKIRKFDALLSRYEDSMRALGTISDEQLAVIRKTHETLITKYFTDPTKENYMEFIATLKPAAPLMSSVITGWQESTFIGEVRWAEAPSLHSLWNLMHQFLLVDVCLYNFIGTTLPNRTTLVGERDAHVDLLSEMINTAYTPVRDLKAPTILVNERPGVVTIILRDVGKSDAEHSGVVTVNFNDKSFDFTLSLEPLDEKHLTLQAEEIQHVLANAGIPSKINSEAIFPIFIIGQGEATREKLEKLLNTSRTQWKDLPRTSQWLMDEIKDMMHSDHDHHHHEEPHEHVKPELEVAKSPVATEHERRQVQKDSMQAELIFWPSDSFLPSLLR